MKAVNSIAKIKNIPTIELQHGIIGKNTIAYNFYKKMNIATFPDFIFLFGDFWKNEARFPINDSKLISVGWPYYEIKRNRYLKLKEKNLKNKILFLSQGTVGKDLSKIAFEVSKMLDPNYYKIIYKLHPCECSRWIKEYPWLVGSNIDVICSNENDIHFYFSQASAQVGVYSTAIFEGLSYGLKTFICKLYKYYTMNVLYEKEYAILIETATELSSHLKKLCEANITKTNVDQFFKNNSLDNIKKNIETIIKW
jgi:hypothetical protein